MYSFANPCQYAPPFPLFIKARNGVVFNVELASSTNGLSPFITITPQCVNGLKVAIATSGD